MSRYRPFPVDGDMQYWIERHENLRRLYEQIKDYNIWLLPPDTLQSFGVHASQVDLTDDENLHFSPSFFRPHPGRNIVQQTRSWWGDQKPKWPSGLEDYPFPGTFDDALKRCQEDPKLAGNYLYWANHNYIDELTWWVNDQKDMLKRALRLDEYVFHCVHYYATPPVDQMGNEIGCRQDLPDLESWW